MKAKALMAKSAGENRHQLAAAANQRKFSGWRHVAEMAAAKENVSEINGWLAYQQYQRNGEES